jgi:hypothetical protein
VVAEEDNRQVALSHIEDRFEQPRAALTPSAAVGSSMMTMRWQTSRNRLRAMVRRRRGEILVPRLDPRRAPVPDAAKDYFMSRAAAI